MMKLLVKERLDSAIRGILNTVILDGNDVTKVVDAFKGYVPEDPYGYIEMMGITPKAGRNVFDTKLAEVYDKTRGAGTNSAANLLKGGYRRRHRKTGRKHRKSRKSRKTRRNQ